MIDLPFESSLKDLIEKQIKISAENLADDVVTDYAEALRKRLASIISNVSLELFSMMSMERIGSTLCIEIKLPEHKQ